MMVWSGCRTRGHLLGAVARRGFEHAAATDAQLFSMSDVLLMRFSRFYRFEADLLKTVRRATETPRP